MVLGVQGQRGGPLLEGHLTGRSPGLFSRRFQGRQENRQQQGDDGDHHQQLDQREGCTASAVRGRNWKRSVAFHKFLPAKPFRFHCTLRVKGKQSLAGFPTFFLIGPASEADMTGVLGKSFLQNTNGIVFCKDMIERRAASLIQERLRRSPYTF